MPRETSQGPTIDKNGNIVYPEKKEKPLGITITAEMMAAASDSFLSNLRETIAVDVARGIDETIITRFTRFEDGTITPDNTRTITQSHNHEPITGNLGALF